VGKKPEEYTVPKYLFRYRSFKDRFDSLRRILAKNEWYFGSRLVFDDQDDCKLPGILLDRDSMRSLLAKKDGKLTKAREDEIERFLADPSAERRTVEEVQDYVNRVGILCLSELHEDPELWRIYADSGRGVCLCLETLQIVSAADYAERGPFEVMYSDDPKHPWDPRGDKSYQVAQTEDHLIRKSTKWAYQKEWRFIVHRGRESTVGDHPMPPAALRAVILGPRLTEAEREEVTSWIKSGPFAHALCSVKSQ
jgi:hypothetical protein